MAHKLQYHPEVIIDTLKQKDDTITEDALRMENTDLTGSCSASNAGEINFWQLLCM